MLDNLSDLCNKKAFKDDVVVEEFKPCVSALVDFTGCTKYSENMNRINEISSKMIILFPEKKE
ncbi:hypothetical protein A0J61_09521 [Choanephora cucurbitarum]|uniref:Uncharacterized protein n=1 Tax=Choanephora cucurbitarum TaxID=101091 RepID=A0A1C7MZZ0_9FUNG|nr:hypothetical protein A0J61_09521 [Choanephora cucurbitarum]